VTKFEVADCQLRKAIELYCSKEPIPAITLAGAAEEILGHLVKQHRLANALDEEIADRCELFETFFGRSAARETFRTLMNDPRNELKHLRTGSPIDFDLDEEATNLIARAIANFQKLRPGYRAEFQRFEDAAATWYRAKSKQVV
jgi:hypothetical protein